MTRLPSNVGGKPGRINGVPSWGCAGPKDEYLCGTFDQSRPSGAVASASLFGMQNPCSSALFCGFRGTPAEAGGAAVVTGSVVFNGLQVSDVNFLRFFEAGSEQVCRYLVGGDGTEWAMFYSVVALCQTRLGGTFIDIEYQVSLSDGNCIQWFWNLTYFLSYPANQKLLAGVPYTLINPVLNESDQPAPYTPTSWSPTARVQFSP